MDLIYRYDPFQPIAASNVPDANAARDRLAAGNARFAEIVTRMQLRLLGAEAGEPMVIPVSPVSLGLPLVPGVATTQAPFALVLGCSDARAPVEAIFDQSFNDLFVVRIAGNVLGTECLGSVDYAVRHLGQSLKLVVVLGHTGCGAVTAAVDSYQAPAQLVDIAFTHALRSLVDRIQIAVRGAAQALQQAGTEAAVGQGRFRAALIEAAVYLNTAVTAYDLRRQVRSLGNTTLPIVYGVYDLADMRVRSLPGDMPDSDTPPFAEAPEGPEGFVALGACLAERIATRRVSGLSSVG
jgi:carbonic anhydrase